MASDGGGGGALDAEEGWGMETRVRPLPDYVSPEPQLPILMSTTTTITTAPALDRERSSYGAGGKARATRKSGRKSCPYERPVVGPHAAAGSQAAAILGVASAQALAERSNAGGAWLGSGISKILTTGATYLYSSIFRRQLPVPLLVLDVDATELDADQQVSSPSVDADNNQTGNGHANYAENHDDHELPVANSSLSDVEKLLKQTTLSREEFQRLTALLQSRVVNNAVEKKQQSKHVAFDVRPVRQDIHPSGGKQSEAQRWRQDLQKAREERENGVRTLTIYENGGPSSATPARASESVDALSSSPVEVAIAFMGGRAPRLSGTPPAEPLNQRDENRSSSGPPSLPNASQTMLTKWTAPDTLNEDQFFTPPPPTLQSWRRNRTIIRTPYSRPLRFPPSRERVIDGTFGTPSATRWTPIRTPVTGGREMLKRRSTVFDEGLTSGGPIRRTRQKAIGSAISPNLSQSRGSLFPTTPIPGSSLMTLGSSPEGKLVDGSLSQRNVVASPVKEKAVLIESGNFYVPAQSSETARKILETLERMTSSPKGKAFGEELAHVRDTAPTTLTEGMLNDQARKSMTFVEYASPSESREPGPSGRSLVNESPSLGYSGNASKISDSSTKLKGKGKASLPPTENGPGGSSGALISQERLSTAEGTSKQNSVRSKEADTVLVPDSDKGKGFRMTAVFEESGSEDEGRMASVSVSTPSFPSPISKLSTIPKSSTVTPSVFEAATFSPTTSSGAASLSFTAGISAADTSKVVSTGFTFPIRAPLEGPPTPKAMSPAISSPKAIPAAPFFQFAQTVESQAVSGSTPELNSTVIKVNSPAESNAEFSFSSPSAVVVIEAQAVPKLQPIMDSKVHNTFKQGSPSVRTPSSTAAPAMLSSVLPAGATNTTSTSTTSNLGDSFSAPISSTSLKVEATPANSSPFGQLFASRSGLVQSVSGTSPSMNLFASNSGSGTGPPANLFASNTGIGTSALPSLASPGFGQLNSFAFKNTSASPGPLVSTDSQASGAKESSTPLLDPERPQKRSMSSYQQDLSKRQQPLATMSSHSFTTFGTSVGTSAAMSAIPVTFAANSTTPSTSQGLFSIPSFGQASSTTPQTSSSLPSAALPFAFSIPASTAGSMSSASSSASLSAGFASTPSFPSFPSSVFGTVSSGSTFGIAPAAAPMAFGSTTTASAFGSTGANAVFGGFVSEAMSQSPSLPVFGSGFTTPSPSTTSTFSFGTSSPAFAFGPGSASSSGSAFAFGSSGAFPFAANKSGTPSPIFGLASSAPAFGSTTNGTMASDVVVNDQSSMDDNSMAEEPSQIGGSVSAQPSIFGAQSSAGTGSFVFGAQTGAPGASAPTLFGGFPSSVNPTGFAAAPANPFAAPQPGSLDYGGGSFTLGSGGDRPTRKMFKAKRTGAKRGK